MIDVLEDVRDHYRATGLTERLKTALAALARKDQQFTPPGNWAALSTSFHTPRARGYPPSLASWPGSPPTCQFWDVGLRTSAGRHVFWPRPVAARLRASTSASRSWMAHAI